MLLALVSQASSTRQDIPSVRFYLKNEREQERDDRWKERPEGRREREGKEEMGREARDKQPAVAISCCGRLHAISSGYSNNLTKFFFL